MLSSIQMTRKEKKNRKKQESTATSHFPRTKNYNQKLQASINFRFCTNYIEAVTRQTKVRQFH